LDTHPWLALEDENLISLCDECHNEEHPEKMEAMQESNQKKSKKFTNVERWE